MAKEGETHRKAFESSSSRWLRLLISESVKGEKKFRVIEEKLGIFFTWLVSKEQYPKHRPTCS